MRSRTRRSVRLSLVFAILGACTRQSSALPEVEFWGEEPDTIDIVRREIVRFVADTAPMQTRVRAIHFLDLGVAGGWDEAKEVIVLDPSLAEDELVRVLRHELCHALDTSIGYTRGMASNNIWTELSGEALFEDPTSRCSVCVHDPVGEAFATVCEAGAWIAHNYNASCTQDEDSRAANAFAEVARDVWVGFMPRDALRGAAWAGVSTDEPPHAVYGDTTADPETILVLWEEGPGKVLDGGLFDVTSGAFLGRPEGWPPGPPWMDAPEPWPEDVVDASVFTGHKGGDAGVILHVDVPLFHGLWRAFVWTGGRYARAEDGCGGAELIAGGGRVLVLASSDRRISWHPLLVP